MVEKRIYVYTRYKVISSISADLYYLHICLYSNSSLLSNVQITTDSTDNAILSWQRKPGEDIPILGYVIHMIKMSEDHEEKVFKSIHLDYKKDKEQHIFRSLKELVKVKLRVCIQNSLCLQEKSCSREVSLSGI